jgi:hypothetical protein
MPTTAQGIELKFNENHSSKKGRTINAGSYRLVLNGKFLRRVLQHGHVGYQLVDTVLGGNPTGFIRASVAANLLNQHDNLTFGGGSADYSNAKANPVWRQLYHRQSRQLFFRTAIGNEALAGANIDSYPCHYCGIILPEKLIQVDHQLPKAGAPGAAILKTLHSLNGGLTTSAAHGAKNIQAANIAASHVAALATIPVKGYAFGKAWNAPALPLGGAKALRYSLTPEGETFLTIAIMMLGEQRFTNECINSILNLVPACASCNGAAGKGNMVHAN